MDSRIASALRAAFPGRDVDELGATGPSWNDKNHTVAVDFADGDRVFLKVATDGDGSRVACERAVLDYVREHAPVAVPAVVRSDPEAAVPYLATAPVDGENFLAPWDDADLNARAELVREVGRSLASVHAMRFADHGHVVGGDASGLELDAGPWTDVLVDRVERMRELASSERFDRSFDDVVAAVESARGLLADAPAALVHGDPAKPNCFVVDGDGDVGGDDGVGGVGGDDGVGFLDWEIAHVGDPARDLYRARTYHVDGIRQTGPDELAAALYDGYRDRAGSLPEGFETRRPVYEAVRFLGTAGHVGKVADFLDEDEDELAEWVESEMDRRLAAVSDATSGRGPDSSDASE